MGNEWDTGLHKELIILASEAVNKWGNKLYDDKRFTQLTVRVKEQKVTLKWDDNIHAIEVVVEFGDQTYDGIIFKRNDSKKWVYSESWSQIKIEGTVILKGSCAY